MKYDVIIIGAGPAGYPCAIRLGQLKKKTLVIEEKVLGGLCLNWGCIPTKSLSFAAETIDMVEKASRIGIKADYHGVDIELLKKFKDNVINRLRSGVEFLFKKHGIVLKYGTAKLVSENGVECVVDGKRETAEAENIIIATGTEVAPLPGLDFDGRFIIDTNGALELTGIPARLLVVGAGASGLEMATVYSHFGSNVTVVEIMEQVLPGMERELCSNLQRIISKAGIEILLKSTVSGYEIKNGKVMAKIKSEGNEVQEEFDKILVTVGRRPATASFQGSGIAVDSKGYIRVDSGLRTSVKNIFAIGDITGPPLLAHKATKQGMVCAEVVSGIAVEFNPQYIPSCVFTIPAVASIGLTEQAALERGYRVRVGKFPYRAAGKAIAMCETEGFAKIVAEENGNLLGIHILGADAPTLIGEAVLAVSKQMNVADLANIIHPHPTLTEIIGEAAENFFKKATHIVN